MKKINFLKKLKKEGKLELVEPNEEVKQSYINKSESNIISAKILLENNRLEEAVALAYYSMYNNLVALFYKIGIKSENHSVSIILLKEIFDLDNKEISFAKKERIDKQYYVGFKIQKEEVKDAIIKAERFNSELHDFISNIANEDIKMYREKFQKLIEND